MNTRKISVIVPVFNVESFLNKCIESIISQTYKNIEIIIVDDGSIDGSAVICDKYALVDSRIKVIHKKNGGVSTARNVGLNIAQGEYVAFVDSDDYLEIDYLSVLYTSLIITNSDISICQINKISDYSQIIIKDRVNKYTEISGSEAIEKMLYQNNVINAVFAKLYKRELIDNNIFDNNIKYAEDLEFNYSVIKNARRVVINEARAYNYFNREGSAMRSKFNPSRMDGLLVVSRILDDTVKFNNALKRSARNRYFMEAFFIQITILESNNITELNKVYYDECSRIIKDMRRHVIIDIKIDNKQRLISLMSIFNSGLAAHLAVFKSKSRLF